MYNENDKKRTLKYRKEKQHSVSLSYRQDEFDSRIRPAIERSEMPVATFIKIAIDEKIKRDGLDKEE